MHTNLGSGSLEARQEEQGHDQCIPTQKTSFAPDFAQKLLSQAQQSLLYKGHEEQGHINNDVCSKQTEMCMLTDINYVNLIVSDKSCIEHSS